MNGSRVLLADDHPATRAGIRLALERAGFTVCAETATGAQAVAAALREQPDVCLLDIRMPEGGGIAAAEDISRRVPTARVVMLTVSTDEADLFAALKAGALGYLLKDIRREELASRLGAILAGEAQLPPSLLTRLVEEFRSRETRKHRLLGPRPGVDLTNREWEVLELLKQGQSTREIAERLVIADVTVRSHVAALLHKLRVPDRRAMLELVDER